jgi:predicted MPP superfamily phosphohydrolase
MSIFTIVLIIFGISQTYWGWRLYRLAVRLFPSRVRRMAVCAPVLAFSVVAMAFNFGWFGPRPSPIRLTAADALLGAPFLWWLACSIIGFVVAALFSIPQAVVALARRFWTKRDLESPDRRRFLGRTAAVASAAPFVAGAYGLLYGRLNLETTTQKIHLPKLPRQFHGFRICQLSDIHIGPFMPKEEIRRYAAIANALKPDLTVLTGDFVTFDAATQGAVVEALSGIRAPYGVYGCLGNHDAWSGVEDSITELFRGAGVRILRGENVPVVSHGESFNLMGVDFQSRHRFGPSPAVEHLLANIEGLIQRDRVNILLSHNPDTFPRAAELGIDLSMAGHTHGGQASLEFISPEIAPSRLVTPYVAGHFQKAGGQLYVNRGIGTIFIPIRIGAPPEITVYELMAG